MKLQDLTTPLFESTCAPLAISRVLGLPYDEVHQTCVRFKLWNPRIGMRDGQILHAIRKLGWGYEEQTKLAFVRKVSRTTGTPYWGLGTLNQLLPKLDPSQKYIITLKDHAIAYVDGQIHDDAQYGHKHRVKGVYRIIPRDQVTERRERREKRRKLMFHGTTTTFLDSILKHGLLVNPPRRTYTRDEKRHNDHLETMGGIYLTSRSYLAGDAADAATRKFGGDNLIVTVMYQWGQGDIDEDKIASTLHTIFMSYIDVFYKNKYGRPHDRLDGSFDKWADQNLQQVVNDISKNLIAELRRKGIFPNRTGTPLIPKLVDYILMHLSEYKIYNYFMIDLRHDRKFVAILEQLMNNVRMDPKIHDHNVRVHQNITFRGSTRIVRIHNERTEKVYYQEPGFEDALLGKDFH